MDPSRECSAISPNVENPVVKENSRYQEKPLPIELFQLQYDFAQRAVELGESLPEALMKFTPFYLRVGGDKSKWETYLQSIQSGDSPIQKAHDMYLQNDYSKPDDRIWFGSFTFDINEDTGTVSIHFSNHDSFAQEKDLSPLDSSRVEIRKEELTHMFQHIQTEYTSAQKVIGPSWIYNLERFRNLLPPIFTNEEHMKPWETKHAENQAIWGQFLNRHGKVNQIMEKEFRAKMSGSDTTEELLKAFRYQAQIPEANINSFYRR